MKDYVAPWPRVRGYESHEHARPKCGGHGTPAPGDLMDDTMLQTRLWMGSILVLVTAGMLVLDQRLAPWYPFLFVFVVGLSLAAVVELIRLLGGGRYLQAPLLAAGVALLVTTNWWGQLVSAWGWFIEPTTLLLGTFVVLVLAVFIWEMATFQPSLDSSDGANGAIERMSRTIWAARLSRSVAQLSRRACAGSIP